MTWRDRARLALFILYAIILVFSVGMVAYLAIWG